MLTLIVLLFLKALAAPDDTARRAAEYMEAQARVNHFSGVVLVARDGKVVFTHSYGFANAEKRVPNTVDTRFRIASITKIFTAAAVLMLRDEGKLRLENSICEYIKGCPETWKAITLKHLLTHSSGIPDDFAEFSQLRREHGTPAEFIEAIKKHAPTFTPGARSQYSNSGYILLGGVIARVTGDSYANFLRKRIFEPLNMKQTIAETSHTPGVGTLGYSWTGTNYQKTEQLDISGLSSATMVVSTAPDLFRFAESFQEGKLLKKSTVTEMWSPQIDQSGYGWQLSTVDGRKAVSRGGEIEGFSSGLYYYPEDHVAIVSLSNIGGVAPSKLIDDLTAISFGEPYSVPHDRTFIHLSPNQMQPLVGTYRETSGGTICVTVQADQLMMAPGNGSAAACRPESADRCFLQPISDDVTFARDANGAVIGFRMGNHATLDAHKKSNIEYKECPALFAH